jgi:hypothetical protein
MSNEVKATESTKEPDLSTWYSQPEVCQILGLSRRWLNAKLQDGEFIIERRRRRMQGPRVGFRRNKTETCYYPPDVDRVAEERKPKPVVLTPEPKKKELTRDEQINLPMQQVMAMLEHNREQQNQLEQQRLLEQQRRCHSCGRGPWLTILDAARESGLRPSVIRRVVVKMLNDRSPDVYRDGVLKVRRAVLGELRAEDLDDPPGTALPARSAAASLYSAEG